MPIRRRRRAIAARGAVAAGVIALAVGWMPAASASPEGIYEQTVTSEGVACFATSTDGSLFVRAKVGRNSLGADDFQMRAYDTASSGDLRYEAFGAPGNWTSSHLQGRGEIIDADGNPVAGEASMSASFRPVGDPVEKVVRVQEGNSRIVATITTQRYEITNPVVTVTGFEIGPLDCAGDHIVTHTMSTTPAAYIDNDRTLETLDSEECSLPGGGGDVYGRVDGRRLTLTLSELPGDLDIASGTVPLRGTSGTSQLSLTDPTGASMGTAQATVSVTKAGNRTAESFSEDGIVVVRTVTPYRLALSLNLPSGPVSTTCDMQLISNRLRVRLP
ncbi:hypothetical protein ACFVZH_39605 [Streptomyces sp. NPDC059534]|uniref:hypothetical protein n=1 Tax=Streptomyces sp. NPDC059534 TaxID=3346859 RepID=UPI0036784D37